MILFCVSFRVRFRFRFRFRLFVSCLFSVFSFRVCSHFRFFVFGLFQNSSFFFLVLFSFSFSFPFSVWFYSPVFIPPCVGRRRDPYFLTRLPWKPEPASAGANALSEKHRTKTDGPYPVIFPSTPGHPRVRMHACLADIEEKSLPFLSLR